MKLDDITVLEISFIVYLIETDPTRMVDNIIVAGLTIH